MCLQMKAKIRKVYRLRIKQYARDRVTIFKKAKFTKGNLLLLTIPNIIKL